MAANDKQITATLVLLCRPADKLGKAGGIGDGEVIDGTEFGILCQHSVLCGVAARAVVRFAFSFAGGFHQDGNRHIVARGLGSLACAFHQENVVFGVAARHVEHEAVATRCGVWHGNGCRFVVIAAG